jgi:hypothetical protein
MTTQNPSKFEGATFFVLVVEDTEKRIGEGHLKTTSLKIFKKLTSLKRLQNQKRKIKVKKKREYICLKSLFL